MSSEAPDGVRPLLTVAEIGGHPGDEALLAALDRLPLDGVMFALSRAAQVLQLRGESDLVTQHLAEHFLPAGELRDTVGHRLIWGYVYSTRRACIALARIALSRCQRGSTSLSDDDRAVLGRALLAVNEHLLGDQTTPPSEEGLRSLVRFGLFLGVNSAGFDGPSPEGELCRTFGALVARHALPVPEMRAVTGFDLRGLHAALSLLSAPFHAPVADAGYADVQWMLREDDPAKEMLNPIIYALAAEPQSLPLTFPQAATPVTAAGWRPLFVSGAHWVCWDPDLFRRLPAFNLPEVVRALAPDATGLHGGVDHAWNEGVEGAVAEALGLYAVVERVPQRKGEKSADWLVEQDGDLFVIEGKNLKLPPSTFSCASPAHFEQWMRQKLMERDGFAQVHATLARVRDSGRLSAHRRVWPVVVLPIHVAGDVVSAAWLAQVVASTLGTPDLPNLQRPVAMHLWELLEALATESAGAHLVDWHCTSPTLPLVTQHLGHRRVGLDALVKRGNAAFDEVIANARRILRGGA